MTDIVYSTSPSTSVINNSLRAHTHDYADPDHEHDYAASDHTHTPVTVWDDLRTPLSATKAGGSKDPGYQQFRDDGAGSQGVFAYHFSPTSEEELYFEIQMPHGWDEGSAIHPHLHWSPGASTSTNVVRWGLEYTIANALEAPGDVFGVTVLDYANQAGAGVAYSHQLVEFTPITMTGLRVSCVLVGRLFRAATHQDDDFAADAVGVSFDIHYQSTNRGTVEEYHT